MREDIYYRLNVADYFRNKRKDVIKEQVEQMTYLILTSKEVKNKD